MKNRKFKVEIYTDVYICYYSNLCDVDNFEILEKDTYYKEWKEGKRLLYSNKHTIKVYELNNVLIN